MSFTTTNLSARLPINEEVADLVFTLLGPRYSLVAMVVIEERHEVIICRSQYYHSIVVLTGDLADQLLGDNFLLDDAIATCEALGIVYHVEM